MELYDDLPSQRVTGSCWQQEAVLQQHSHGMPLRGCCSNHTHGSKAPRPSSFSTKHLPLPGCPTRHASRTAACARAPAQPRVLDPPKGRHLAGDGHLVQPDHAVLEALGHTPRARQVLHGKEGRRQGGRGAGRMRVVWGCGRSGAALSVATAVSRGCHLPTAAPGRRRALKHLPYSPFEIILKSYSHMCQEPSTCATRRRPHLCITACDEEAESNQHIDMTPPKATI